MVKLRCQILNNNPVQIMKALGYDIELTYAKREK